MLKISLPQGKYVLALSGGADSVALLCLLVEEGVLPLCLHCNFHLRGEESDRDEQFVRELCQKRGVQLLVKHFDTTKVAQENGESIEMAARRLRYEWFEEVRAAEGYDYILTAHHRDDQVETVLLNLVRGTGLKGLRGMLPLQGRICRPLLAFSRDDLREYLKEKGQAFVEDSSNSDVAYQRNLIRHELRPLLKQLNVRADEHIAATAEHLQEAEHLMMSTQETWEDEHCVILPDGVRVNFSADNRVGAVLHDDAEWMVVRTASGIEVRRRPEKIPPTLLAKATRFSLKTAPTSEELRNKDKAMLDAHMVKGQLYVRSLCEGDRFQPYGMTKGSQLVSDYLTNRHRSRIEKLAQLVVCDEEGIVWLVGETISQRCAITPRTTEILEILREDLRKS